MDAAFAINCHNCVILTGTYFCTNYWVFYWDGMRSTSLNTLSTIHREIRTIVRAYALIIDDLSTANALAHIIFNFCHWCANASNFFNTLKPVKRRNTRTCFALNTITNACLLTLYLFFTVRLYSSNAIRNIGFDVSWLAETYWLIINHRKSISIHASTLIPVFDFSEWKS